MNVGTARLNVVNSSQPQVLQSPSQRSLSASDHSSSSYYASGASSVGQRNAALQYETPPSKAPSPNTIKPVESEMTLPSRPVAAHPAPVNIRRSQPPPTPPAALYRQIYDLSPGVDETPYMRFAIEQLTRDEELMGRGRQGSIDDTDYPVERIVPDEGLGYYTASAGQAQAPEPPKKPAPTSIRNNKRPVDDMFIPIDPPQQQYPRLGYLPLILRPTFLLLFICICLLMIAGLIFCNVYCLQNDGLYDYDGTGTARYFVFQFMPQLLGIMIVLWIFVLQAAVYRIIPFASMSSRRYLDRVLQDMSIHSANFLIPDLRHFECGEPIVGLCMVVFWISYFTIPLLSCMFQTQLFDVDGVQQWRWTSVQAVVWILVALYVLLLAASILVMLRFRRSRSALIWDPVSLADLILLFQKSNIMPDFEGSEISESIRAHLPPRSLRLGYWTTTRDKEIFYTVGEENAPTRRRSKEQAALIEKNLSGFDSATFDVQYQRYSHAESFTRNIHSPFFRYRWTPWYLRDSAVVAWIVAALILYLAFLIISFVNQAVEQGFLPRLETLTNPQGFSPSNFLFSFLPSLLGMIFFLAWQPIDTHFRAIQPFANLSSDPQGGAPAERTLLLSYPSLYPIQTTILAFLNTDYRVAWTSFISLLSLTLPVLAGGVFTAQFFEGSEVRIAASMPAYYALCVFLGLYAFSFLLVWPKRKRYLPHRIETLADYLSFLYQSPLLRDEVFEGVRSKGELVAKLVGERETGVRGGEKAKEKMRLRRRYLFGVYVGRDGREHLGIA